MRLYGLEKYPVITKSGNEYRVVIQEDTIGCTDTFVYIKTKGLFGRTKFQRVYGDGFTIGVYDAKDWNYNYVAIAKDTVNKYEILKAREELEEKSKHDGIDTFEEWNGQI